MSKLTLLKKKWLYTAIGGIFFIGFGLSLLGDSIILKSVNADFYHWFVIGTVAFILFFTGLSLFGNAINLRTQIDFYKKRKIRKDKKNKQ
jgi:hypothetical protein